MLDKLKSLFKSQKESPEQIFLQEYNLQIDPEYGFIIDGQILNQLSERLVHFSNRKLSNFDDLEALYYKAILINEKIDLEIANQRYVARLGNTHENLLEFKAYIQILNDYYRQFKREK